MSLGAVCRPNLKSSARSCAGVVITGFALCFRARWHCTSCTRLVLSRRTIACTLVWVEQCHGHAEGRLDSCAGQCVIYEKLGRDDQIKPVSQLQQPNDIIRSICSLAGGHTKGGRSQTAPGWQSVGGGLFEAALQQRLLIDCKYAGTWRGLVDRSDSVEDLDLKA